MPYKSEKQRKYLRKNKPDVARKFDKHGAKAPPKTTRKK